MSQPAFNPNYQHPQPASAPPNYYASPQSYPPPPNGYPQQNSQPVPQYPPQQYSSPQAYPLQPQPYPPPPNQNYPMGQAQPSLPMPNQNYPPVPNQNYQPAPNQNYAPQQQANEPPRQSMDPFNGYKKPVWNGLASFQPNNQDNPTWEEILNSLRHARSVHVKQQVGIFEALSQGCCEQANEYAIFNAETGQQIFTTHERSGEMMDQLCRCCCDPYHSVSLDTARNNSVTLLDRPGCPSKPMLCCFSCTEMCAQTAEILPGPQGPRYTIKETCMNGMTPELVITDVSQNREIAKIIGPSVFGGCSELFMDSHFTVLPMNGKDVNRNAIATITKKKPEGCAQFAAEAFTDSDNFLLQFYQSEYESNAEFKAALVASLLMLDFIFFEFDNGMCEPTNDMQGCKTTFFNCYCCGCICPCSCTCKNSDDKNN